METKTTAKTIMTIEENLARVGAQVETACNRAGRDVNPRLVAVSKRQPDERIAAVLETGHRVFG